MEKQISITIPFNLWEQLHAHAHINNVGETILLIQAVEEFLQRCTMQKRLESECDQLAMMTFDDVGTDDEWLAIENEALEQFEMALGKDA